MPQFDVTHISSEPIISVGILEAPKIRASLHGEFTTVKGENFVLHTPLSTACSFTLKDVEIGRGFHWQQRQRQRFRGALRLLRHEGRTIAINEIPLEEYLKSVVSSEMKATASLEFLKAHAIVSRSWLLAMLAKKQHPEAAHPQFVDTPTEIFRWYDRQEHELYDVCADDHCQRYQGVGRITNPRAIEAVEQTCSQVLTFDGEICDARFSKCCGGSTELFENCWEPVPHPYLPSVADTDEAGHCFCDTHDKAVLAQVLNDFDLQTSDFFSWQVTYSSGELSELIRQKSGRDLGDILELRPLQRGASGRIVRLLVRGTKGELTVGKELEIRRMLSHTHLKSSNFIVQPLPDGGFRLQGSGWGHGVGMCQIGAAVMGSQGFSHTAILHHYFPLSQITTLY